MLRPRRIEGVWEFTPQLHADDRGAFLEAFRAAPFAEVTGRPFPVAQTNISTSRKGTVRGIHFADVPPGQAKFVQCFAGRVLDVIVDIRVGSPTFGEWDAVELNGQDFNAVYVSEGLGHGFCALSETATVGYLCSESYAPTREHGITPVDPAMGLPWPDIDLLLSPKDTAAPTLDEALAAGLLPNYADCQAFIATLP